MNKQHQQATYEVDILPKKKKQKKKEKTQKILRLS